jgi:predicted nucleic acid-binding protein
MSFASIASGESVFVDANPFIYHFASNVVYGPACTQLLERIARQDVVGFTSAHVLTNVAHRLMTIEAMARNGWPEAGIASRLKKHRAEIANLSRHRLAIDEIAAFGVQVIPITQAMVVAATVLSQQHQLLSGDALVIVAMQSHGLAIIASEDDDFDGIPGITRYEPA